MASVPKVEIIFKQKAATLIKRTGEQTVCLLLDQYTRTGESESGTEPYYKKVNRLSEIDVEELAAAVPSASYDSVYRCLQYCFASAPSKVIVSNLSWSETWTRMTESDDVYAVAAFIGTGTTTMPSTMLADVKSLNENDGYPISAIYTSNGLTQPSPRGTHLICVGSNNLITYVSSFDGSELSESEKLALYAGAVASCGVERSLTNYTLPYVASVKKGSASGSDVYEAATAAGIITARMSAGKARVVAGINTAETSSTVTEDMQYIEVICTMDTIAKDIEDTFAENYRGLYKNNYNRQLLFIAAVTGYFTELMEEEVLDPNFDNRCDVDVEHQRAAWIANGTSEAADWDDGKVKLMSFKRTVYLEADVKINQSMENLTMYITLM